MPSERGLEFPAAYRLKRRVDFQRVYSQGARETGRHLVLFVMRAEEGDGRFGVTASRRIGGAVKRARAKRRLRELYRLHRAELPRHAAYDIVANARQSCVMAPWGELERDFSRCLSRAMVRADRRAAGAPIER